MTPAHAGPPRGGFAPAIPLSLIIAFALLASAAQAASAAVTIRDATFQPASVTVNVGESVTWTNQDGIPHSAKADNGSFDTGVFSSGSRSVTFGSAGTFGYFCAVHPTTMRGSVRVLGQATPAPTPPPPPPPTAPPTPAPTPPPTVAPTIAATTAPPQTVAPATAPPSPSPSPSPTPTQTSTPSPAATGSPTASAVAVGSTVSPTPAATVAATGGSRPDEGPGLGLIAAVAAGLAALAGVGLYVARRP